MEPKHIIARNATPEKLEEPQTPEKSPEKEGKN
jgi:hypothetical protein